MYNVTILWFTGQWFIELLWHCFLIFISCSGDTMFEEKETIWTASRAAWKLPIAYSWPGIHNRVQPVDTIFTNFTIFNSHTYYWIVYSISNPCFEFQINNNSI
jgi:hypothetical protein